MSKQSCEGEPSGHRRRAEAHVGGGGSFLSSGLLRLPPLSASGVRSVASSRLPLLFAPIMCFGLSISSVLFIFPGDFLWRSAPFLAIALYAMHRIFFFVSRMMDRFFSLFSFF